MSDSLSTLTTKLQALLMDGGTLFTSTTCTAAIRQALSRMNVSMPVHAATLIDTVEGQFEYELTTALAGATPIHITDVLLADPSGGEYDVPLTFRPYMEDERWFFRLDVSQPADEQLIVRFTQPHTISGLDSETESTLTAMADVVLFDAAAEQACLVAAAGKVEANNLDPAVCENYRKAAAAFNAAFVRGLAALSRTRRMQVSVEDTRAWNDDWHGRLQ